MQGHDEPQLVAALRGHLLENAEQLTGFALCDVLWSLAVLDQLSLEGFRHMCGRLEQLTLGSFEPEVCPDHNFGKDMYTHLEIPWKKISSAFCERTRKYFSYQACQNEQI